MHHILTLLIADEEIRKLILKFLGFDMNIPFAGYTTSFFVLDPGKRNKWYLKINMTN